MLGAVPPAWRRRCAAIYDGIAKAQTQFDANRWMLDTFDRVGSIQVPVTMDDAELCELADKCAVTAMSLGEVAPGVWLSDMAALRGRMAAFVGRYGISPPDDEKTDAAAVKRMTSPAWWRRGLRKVQGRAIESEAIRFGFVSRKGEIYASDVAVERRTQQRRRNAAGLEATEAINLDTGESYNLGELAAKSVTNPVIRRGELMVRIRGFEEIAIGLGHVGEFWTATCPSRMHKKASNAAGAVFDNQKYDGTTPREAQQYLTKTWAKFRAAAHRRGLRIYGFRIAEPHHDGTPHWHLLVFTPAKLDDGREAVPRLRALFRRYFLEDSADEPGAKKRRCEFKRIDPDKGTAAGYIAKYISKNIDGGGYRVQKDIEGHDEIVPSSRVEAWASTWGIRQFQQVGGPPVGVWRELRRVQAEEAKTEVVEAARSAADAGNFRRFVEVMGGPVVKRKELPIRVAYTRPGERYDYQRGECYPAEMNRYGEVSPGAVFGVVDMAADRAVPSMRFRWEVRRGRRNICNVHTAFAGKNEGQDICKRQNDGKSSLFGVGEFAAATGEISASEKNDALWIGGERLSIGGVGFDLPWTRVNNCTQGGSDGQVGSGIGETGRGLLADSGPFSGNGGGIYPADD